MASSPRARRLRRDVQPGARRRLGVALAGGCRDRGGGGALGRAADAADRDHRVGEQVRGLVVRALGEEHRPARHGRAQPRGAAHARPVAADLHLVAVADPEPVGVDGRELDDLARPHEPQDRREVDLGAPQRAPGAEPQCAGGRRPAPRRTSSSPAPTAWRPAPRPLEARPAHAAPADRVERQPLVEGLGGEQLARRSGPRPRRGPARRASRRRRSPATGAHARSAPRAPGRPIPGRSRWTRPSGWVIVPSFSAYASAGKTTSAYSRAVSVSTESTGDHGLRGAQCGRNHSPRFGMRAKRVHVVQPHRRDVAGREALGDPGGVAGGLGLERRVARAVAGGEAGLAHAAGVGGAGRLEQLLRARSGARPG